LTCRSWYLVALPHIHHTITLTDKGFGTARCKLKPLPRLHELGLIPLLKEIRVLQSTVGWFAPEAFNPVNLFHFSTFANVHTLKIHGLDMDGFMPGIKRYFHQFSPTLRSVSLYYPTCSAPRHLSCFLSLFPNLDDVEIRQLVTFNSPIPDAELAPFFAPKLAGQLILQDFNSTEAWTHLISISGGLRFRVMVLVQVGPCASTVLEACAGTLERLRFLRG